MGVIAPNKRRSGVYFGCGGAACLGLIFWAIVACCMLLMVVGLSTELDSGDSELVSAFYALSQIMVGSLAFCYSMAAILVVFLSFGVYRRTRKFIVSQSEHYDLNTVLLFFFLFVGGMILAAVLPTMAVEYPGANWWLKAGGVLLGGVYLLYGMLMLWLTLVAYESYRHADEGERQ